jgi:lipocalin
MGSDGKLPTSATAAKGQKGWAQRFLNVGFVAGFLLVLLTYAVVSQQSQRFGAIVASPDGTCNFHLLDKPPERVLLCC